MLKKVQYRLCKVKLKDVEQEFVVDTLDIMYKDKYYPAAHIIDPGNEEENIYLVQAEYFPILCSSDGVEEMVEFVSPVGVATVEDIKVQIANIDLHQWYLSEVVGKYEVGFLSANEDINIRNNVEGSGWKEYFSKGAQFISVRKCKEYDVAVQVRKGAIFYIGTEDLGNFHLEETINSTFSPGFSYTALKELKYIISNLYK